MFLDLFALDAGEQLGQLHALLAQLLDLPLEESAVEWQLDEMGWCWFLVYRQFG